MGITVNPHWFLFEVKGDEEMSKMAKEVKESRSMIKTKRVTNFMGGNSYELNPLDTLKIVTASSIFGEPQYYRDGEFAEKTLVCDRIFSVDKCMVNESVLSDKFNGMTTSQVMEKAINDALEYDYFGTLAWAKTLRNEYYMRLNPQVIMVRAAMSKARLDSNNVVKNPSALSETNKEVMQRADDMLSQLTYYLYTYKGKNNIPNVLKRSWAKKLESLSAYEIAKYKNHGIGMIDAVRISHAHNATIDELMRTGTIVMPEEKKTWETLRASGMSWAEILDTLGQMPHMALLRNLRGIFKEIDDYDKTMKILEELKSGVEHGRQFPFRYMSAIKAIEKANVNNAAAIKDALEECLDISCKNLPLLKGNNAFLSDNSGSAWNSCTSEYGTVTVASIGNLSSVIGAANSDVGTVFTFGDTLIKHEISKRQGILAQATIIDKDKYAVGGSTENGIWLFFDDAIKNKIHYDNIFIYSDEQAGHGGLYGTSEAAKVYKKEGFAVDTKSCEFDYIDVVKLINAYRTKVNPKVNVYCIQTAGYTNMLIPESGYRSNILFGWTGKELIYASAMNRFWDEKDAEREAMKGVEEHKRKAK